MRILKSSNLGYLLLSLATALSVWLGLKAWFAEGERFPFLDAGVYQGEISSRSASRTISQLPFVVLRRSAVTELEFAFLDDRLAVQRIALTVLPVRSEIGYAETSAIQVESPAGGLILTGVRTAVGQYRGKLKELESGVEAEWSVKALEQSSDNLGEPQLKNLKLWLALRSELETVESRLAFMQQELPRQTEEVEKLEGFVTEGAGLKQRADQKYNQVRGLVKAALEKLKLKQQEAKELEEKISLSQRVTPMGRLVSLGRESLAREANWVETMLKLNPQANDDEALGREYARAQKVMELRRAIQSERARIEGQVDETPSEDSYQDPEQ